MTDIIVLYDQVFLALEALGAPVTRWLRPGATDADIHAALGPLGVNVAQELGSVFRWRNGTAAPPATPLGCQYLIPGWVLMSVAEAGAIGQLQVAERRWPPGYAPFFTSGADDYLLLGDGGVYYCLREDYHLDLIYVNLIAMWKTFVRCFSEGIYYLDEEGYLETDDSREASVALELNPGATHWAP